MPLAKTLDELARHAELPPRALPPACYLDPEFWEAELERVLRAGWHAIARTDELPEVGGFRSLDLHGEPILLVRDDSLRLRVFSRVCRHRASLIVEGDGNTKRFTCPYHRWSYDLEGRLCAAPLMERVEGFVRNEHSLPELTLEEWMGFVLVSLDRELAPLAPQLEEIDEVLAALDLASYRLAGTMEYDSPWNWKVLVENFMESYHHLGTHADTLQKTLPAAGTHPLKLTGAGALLDNPGIDGAPGACIGLLFPTLLFFVSRDDELPFAGWYEMQIGAVDHFRLRIHLLMPPELAANEELAKGFRDYLDTIHRQDIETCDRVQRGLSSRLFQPTSLSTQEGCLVRFHRYLAERMAGLSGPGRTGGSVVSLPTP